MSRAVQFFPASAALLTTAEKKARAAQRKAEKVRLLHEMALT